MIIGVNDKGYDKVFWCVEGEFWAWLLGKMGIVFGWVEWKGDEIGRLGGVMDLGVSVWMNQLCEISENSDNLLILTTPV